MEWFDPASFTLGVVFGGLIGGFVSAAWSRR